MLSNEIALIGVTPQFGGATFDTSLLRHLEEADRSVYTLPGYSVSAPGARHNLVEFTRRDTRANGTDWPGAFRSRVIAKKSVAVPYNGMTITPYVTAAIDLIVPHGSPESDRNHILGLLVALLSDASYADHVDKHQI